jgi:hypothetical protein
MIAAPALADDFIPPPAFGPPAVQANVDLYAGFFTLRFDDDDTDSGWLFGGAGRANVPLQSGRNLQLDVQGSTLVETFSRGKGVPSISESSPEFAGYAHWYARDPNSHALGLFAGANFFTFAPKVYTVGIEGQMFWPTFTLYGQASVSEVNIGSSDAWMGQLRAEGQWFLTNDTVAIADAMWSHVNFSGDVANILTLQGQLQHRFNGGPFSGFVRGRFDHVSGDFIERDQFAALLGVRVQADPPGSTEISHRRNGAGMDVLPMPILGLVFTK